VRFTGQAEITIDAKQRLAVPAKFRARLPEGETNWFCVPCLEGGVLRLIPESVFEAQASQLEDSLMPGRDAAELDTTFFGSAEFLEMDASGRVRLPKLHLDVLEMPSEVMVVGARSRLEIHPRAAWQARMTERLRGMQSLIERSDRRGARPGGGANGSADGPGA